MNSATSIRNKNVETTIPIPRISKEDLADKIITGDVGQVINVLEAKGKRLRMITGSINIPLSELPNRMDSLNKNKEIVTYCASNECDASERAATLLQEHGFQVSIYPGGIKEWVASGYPTDDE